MKTALAIVCSLLLIGTLFVPASAPAAGGACAKRSCCSNCSQAACCAANTSPEPQPVSAAPVPPSVHTHLVAPVLGIVAWTLPDTEAGPPGTSRSAAPASTDAPLFARLCVRRI